MRRGQHAWTRGLQETLRQTLEAVIVSAAVAAAVQSLPEPTVARWRRNNFRGREVSLSGGLAAGTGALAGAALSRQLRAPALIAGTCALLAGGYDDLMAPRAEQYLDKGFRGHLNALKSGRVSGGVVKVAVIGAGSLLAAVALPDRDRRSTLVSTALIAGTANLVNLFDLRPGRATKIALASAVVGAGSGSLGVSMAAVVGAGAATLPGDLAEHTMLGDLGANTLGALIGVRLAGASTRTRLIATAVVGGLTVASERVSFTRVIESVPALRWLDELGRRAAS